MFNLEWIVNILDRRKTERELDKMLWKNTKYEGMSFKRMGDWDNYGSKYASPMFAFENGDQVVIDRNGDIKVLKYGNKDNR